MTLTLLSLMFLVNAIMYFHQRRIFRNYGLNIRRNIFGFLLYMLTYQIIMSPASLAGYLSELFRFKKSWGPNDPNESAPTPDHAQFSLLRRPDI